MDLCCHSKSEHGYFTILVLKPNANQSMLQHIRFYSFCAKNIYLIFQICRSDRKTKGKQTVCVIASRQPIGSLTHECNQEWLLDLPCPAGELVIVHWRRRKWVMGGWGKILQYSRWDSWRPLTEPCGLITRPGKCMRQTILNQHSLLQCQCRTETERGHNASAAHPYKHFRQSANYIS